LFQRQSANRSESLCTVLIMVGETETTYSHNMRSRTISIFTAKRIDSEAECLALSSLSVSRRR